MRVCFLQRRNVVIFLYYGVLPRATLFLNWTSSALCGQTWLTVMWYTYLCQKWKCPLCRNDNSTLYLIYDMPLEFTRQVLLLELVLPTLPEHPSSVQLFMGFVLLLLSVLLITSLFGIFIFFTLWLFFTLIIFIFAILICSE